MSELKLMKKDAEDINKILSSLLDSHLLIGVKKDVNGKMLLTVSKRGMMNALIEPLSEASKKDPHLYALLCLAKLSLVNPEVVPLVNAVRDKFGDSLTEMSIELASINDYSFTEDEAKFAASVVSGFKRMLKNEGNPA